MKSKLVGTHFNAPSESFVGEPKALPSDVFQTIGERLVKILTEEPLGVLDIHLEIEAGAPTCTYRLQIDEDPRPENEFNISVRKIG